ncbi:MAG: hypothetical protein AB1599_08590 [Planctomycetota bacterium]
MKYVNWIILFLLLGIIILQYYLFDKTNRLEVKITQLIQQKEQRDMIHAFEDATKIEFGGGYPVDTIEVAAKAGYNYEQVINGCLLKKEYSMHDLFWLTRYAGFDAASSEGNAAVLEFLLKKLGDDFFGTCLSKESIDIKKSVLDMLYYDFGYEKGIKGGNKILQHLRKQYPKTFKK